MAGECMRKEDGGEEQRGVERGKERERQVRSKKRGGEAGTNIKIHE